MQRSEFFKNFWRKPIFATIIAILSGFIVAAIILASAGYNPWTSLGALFYGMFGRPKYISNVIIKSTPIIVTGLSVAFVYKMGLFNIGAEGQYIMGALAANVVGYLVDAPAIIEIPLIILAGVAAGALYGGIIGLLKGRYDINEVITGIMLNWIALYFSNYIVNLEIFHKPNTASMYAINESGYTSLFTQWKTTEAAATFFQEHPFIGDIMRTDVNMGFIIAVALTIFISWVLFKTTKGYQLRAVGYAQEAAEFAGIDVKKNVIQTMLIAGGLAGMAGVLNITGIFPHAVSQLSAFESYGLNGLCVAFIAGGSPIGCILAGLLFGGLLYGGQSLQYMAGAPSEIINIMIGTIVFFVGLEGLVGMIVDRIEKRKAAKSKESGSSDSGKSGSGTGGSDKKKTVTTETKQEMQSPELKTLETGKSQ